MYKLMNDCKGAISIFLVIVLVPMLVLSSIFVDMSRLKLAQSVAESSGNLTLNTALTNYDAVLKDMYGLFATSQNTDELFANLENYYRQCIEAAGVAEADADDYVGQIMQFLRSETGTDDLLNMDLKSFEITKPTEGSLANPAILKSQIVEFMKYRAPINLGSGIFDAISSMKNLKKQTTLVDNKNKFYDQRTNMMEKLEEVWNKLEDHQYRDAYPADGHGFPNGSYMQDYTDRMNDCAGYLKTAIAYTVRYLYYADSNYGSVPEYSVSVNINPSDTSKSQIWTVKQSSNKDYDVKTDPGSYTVSQLKASLGTTYKAIKALAKNTEEYQIIAQGNANLSDTEKIRIVATTNKSLNSGYHNNIKNMVAGMVELINARNAISDDDIKDLWVVVNGDSLSYYDASTDPSGSNKPAGATKLSSFIQTQINSHLTVDASGNITDNDIKIYNALMARVRTYYNDTVGVVNAAKSYVQSYTASANAYADSFHSFLEDKINKLGDASNILSAVKNDLSNSESDYNKALRAWKDSANGLSGDTMGSSDLSEIEKLEKVLTIDKVSKLITRVNAAKSSLESAKTAVEGFKVLNKEWYKLDDDATITSSTLKKLLNSSQKTSIENVSKSTQIQTENVNGSATGHYDKAYDSIINQLQATVLTKTVKTTWAASEAAKSPDLTKNQVELYTWLYNNFFDASKVQSKYGVYRAVGNYSEGASTTASTDVSDHKDDASTSQSEGEGKAEEYNNKSVTAGTEPNRHIDANFLPSHEWEDILKGIEGNGETSNDASSMLSNSSSALSSLDGLFDLVKNMATELRDDLYVTNYIMNMFSYSTFESEITKKNNASIGAFESWYEFKDGKYELKSQFNKEALVKDAKTLTKVSINPNANYLYGQEVEYIIYGQGGVGKTYGTIYMLRFALNTVYAFMDAEIGNITTAAATALFGTPPLTPLIPVAKIAMTIGLSLAESAYDLYQLKSGDKVPLMKSSDTWMMKPSSAGKAIIGEVINEVGSAVIEKGMTELNKVLDMTNDELSKYIAEGEEGINNIARMGVENTLGQIRGYANQAIQEAMTICTNVESLAMEKLDYAQGRSQDKINAAIDELDRWLSSQGSSDSDVIYAAKKAAVDILKKNSGEYLGKIFDNLNKKVGTGSEAIQNLGDDINNILQSVQDEVNTKIDELTNTAGNALQELKNSAMNELKEAAANGAESLKNKLKEQVSAKFGTSSVKETGTTSVMSSLLSWRYSDYLQLFVLMGMVLSPETILLRTADVIELNMQQIDGKLGFIETTTETEVSRLWGLIKYTKTETQTVANAEAYKLSKAYTYLNIKATIDVKPLMLTLPLMASTVKNQLDGSNWYEITYEGTLGY